MTAKAKRVIRVGDLLWTMFATEVVVGTPYENYDYEDLGKGEPLVFIGGVWVLDYHSSLSVKACSRHGTCWVCAHHLSFYWGKSDLDPKDLLKDPTVTVEYDARCR